jgi:hypothetical protein
MAVFDPAKQLGTILPLVLQQRAQQERQQFLQQEQSARQQEQILGIAQQGIPGLVRNIGELESADSRLIKAAELMEKEFAQRRKQNLQLQQEPLQAERIGSQINRAQAGPGGQLPGRRDVVGLTTALEGLVSSVGPEAAQRIVSGGLAQNELINRARIDSQLPEAPKPASLSDVSSLRSQFLKESGDFSQVASAFDRITAVAKEPSAFGDIALIFNFMKMQDPGSTVREGEFATAQNAGGVPQRTRALYNSLISGQRLSESQRTDLLTQSRRLFGAALKRHERTIRDFSGIAKRNKINPKDVVIDLVGDVDTRKKGKAPLPPEGLPQGSRFLKNDSSGKPLFITPDGRVFRER